MSDENKNNLADLDENIEELKEDIGISLGEESDESDFSKEESQGDEEAQSVDEIKKEDNVILPKSKVVLVKKLLDNIKESSDKLSNILSDYVSEEDEALIHIGQTADDSFEPSEPDVGEGKIIEGVFDGENMIGPDGKQYSVPANYASKSKLVEGDILKLTITSKGTFVYKQISPIDRSRVIGTLEKGSDGNCYVSSDNRKWRVLTASVTYFKGEVGDETVILVPKAGDSKWAAVENIVRNPN